MRQLFSKPIKVVPSHICILVAMLSSMMIWMGCHGFPACQISKTPTNVYIRVDYASHMGEFERVKGEVYASDIYKANYANYKTVAVRVPESCLDETAAQKEGQTSGKVILNTTCGAYFSELEKSLVKKGYRVISWDRIKNSYEAAVQLGADIVFMVNSLETSFAKLGAEAKTVYKFYNAKPDGTVIEPVGLTPEDRAVFKGFVEQRILSFGGDVEGKQVYSSIMDVTAITAANGETVWFYNKTTYEKPEHFESVYKSFLFEGRDDEWWPKFPDGVVIPPYQPPAPNYSAEDVESTRKSLNDHENQREQRKLLLIRDVVSDFVDTFSKPEGIASSKPPSNIAVPSAGRPAPTPSSPTPPAQEPSVAPPDPPAQTQTTPPAQIQITPATTDPKPETTNPIPAESGGNHE